MTTLSVSNGIGKPGCGLCCGRGTCPDPFETGDIVACPHCSEPEDEVTQAEADALVSEALDLYREYATLGESHETTKRFVAESLGDMREGGAA